MTILTAVLRRRNLYAEVSNEGNAKWRCACFGRSMPDSKMWTASQTFEAGNAEVTVTFEDRAEILSEPDTPQWQKDNPCGALWIDFSKDSTEPHRVQITINLPKDVYQRVQDTDLSNDDIIVTLSYENLIPRGEGSANAFLSSALVHFQTRFDTEGQFGRELD
jgi:hypothetical protein